MLICGLKNGVIWILHPDSLTSIDQVPFKHSNEAILNVTFSENSQYMAYSVKKKRFIYLKIIIKL